MNLAGERRRRSIGQVLAWAFWGANLAVICWVGGSYLLFFNGTFAEFLVAVARLMGLLATFCVLVQLVIMGRAGWLEPLFGMDKLAIFHRRNGMVAFCFILAHPFLITAGYALTNHVAIPNQYLILLTSYPFIWLAFIAELLFVAAVASSIYAVRKHLKFEVWHGIHFINYLAVAVVIWHQLVLGSHILGSEWFRWYWVGLYVFAALTIIIWRWLWPIVRSARFGFVVDKVEAATPSATSVYIGGKNVDRFGGKGGQFIMVRFLTPKLWFEEHPFSMSMLPSSTALRFTARQLGDFTKALPSIPVGTRVIVSGPHGSFTHLQSVTKKTLYIAGGIGITPVRSLLQERSSWPEPGDAVLLYGNRSQQETALWAEVTDLAAKINMPVFNILSDQPNYKGEKGYIDQEKVERLVPDVRERDIFVCGPPPMVNGILPIIEKLRVPKAQVHFERFSLHKQ